MPPSQKSKSLIVMFVDIPGAVDVRERNGGDAARDFVKECISVISGIIGKHGGSLVRTIGSAALCSFDEGSGALMAACAMHEAIMSSSVGPMAARVLRTGIHQGKVSIQDGSCSGEAVTTVARMVTAARPHQILATGELFAQVSADLQKLMKPLTNAAPLETRLNVKLFEVCWRREAQAAAEAAGAKPGRPGELPPESLKRLTTSFSIQRAGAEPSEARTAPVEVDFSPVVKTLDATASASEAPVAMTEVRAPAETASPRLVIPFQPPNVAPPPAPAKAAPEPPKRAGTTTAATMRMTFRGRVFFIDPHRPILFVGRDSKNDVVVDLDTVSRRHAEVEFRQGEFYLVDHSWNGTFVYDEKGTETVLHNNEVRLGARGMICPGCPGYVPDAEAIVFHRDS